MAGQPLSFLLFAEAWGMQDNDIGIGWMNPLGILDRRLAEGQISVDEHEQRRRVLSGQSPVSNQSADRSLMVA